MGKHVLEEQELAVGNAGQAGAEAAIEAGLSLLHDGVAVNLPFGAVGRVGELVVEAAGRVRVQREGGAEGDIVGVAPGGVEQEQLGAADGPGFFGGVSSWPNRETLAVGLRAWISSRAMLTILCAHY